MSTLLRLPLALLTTSAVLLVSSGVASAAEEGAGAAPQPGSCLLGSLLGCEEEEAPADPADTEKNDVPMGPSEAVPAYTGTPQPLPEQESLSTFSTEGTEGQESDEPLSAEQVPAPGSDGPPDPAVIGACIAEEIQALLALLQESLGGAAEELAGKIEAGLTDPTKLPEFVTGLPALIESTVPELAEELSTELPAAIEAIAGCLPIPTAPPTEEPEPTPPPAKPVTQPAAVHYENCDDARAKGAAPVHAGQPGYGAHLDNDNDGVGCEQEVMAVSHTPTPQAQLAYTGFDAWPFAGAGAAMLAAGSLLVAGARRRS